MKIEHPKRLYPVYPEDLCLQVPSDCGRCGELRCHVKFAVSPDKDWVYVMHAHHEDWEVLKVARTAIEDPRVDLYGGWAEWSKRLHDEFEARAIASIEDQSE